MKSLLTATLVGLVVGLVVATTAVVLRRPAPSSVGQAARSPVPVAAAPARPAPEVDTLARVDSLAAPSPAPEEPEAAPASEPAAGQPPSARRLARIFASMSPRQAAEILGRMRDPEVLEVLDQLRERQVAEILGYLPPERAASLSRLVVGAGDAVSGTLP